MAARGEQVRDASQGGSASARRPMRTLVVKVGSATLVGPAGIDRAFVDGLARQAADLRRIGWRLVVVSSGAIAAALGPLGFSTRPTDMPTLQAAASVGQCAVMTAYDEAFRAQGLIVSQVLLTRHDTARRTAYLHARDALTRLLELGAVPVVNENDTVAVDQIRFGDNDTLAALVSCLVRADLCAILSDIDGFYTANPHDHPDARLVPVIERIDAGVLAAAGDSSSAVGTGGMITKLRAARILMTAGIPMAICRGRSAAGHPVPDDCLVRLARGEQVGTRFAPARPKSEIAPRKLWIALGDVVHGSLVVDAGAREAVRSRGASLLSVGVRGVDGSFERGDVVNVCGPDGFVFARGLAGASADELRLAAGMQQEQIDANHLLHDLCGRPAVHRDEMIVFE